MSPELIAIVMFASMMLLLLTGRHIFAVVGGVAAISVFTLWGTGSLNLVWFSCYSLTGWYVILAIPPFVFMGLMLSRSGVADKLFQALYTWLGRLNGGLAISDVGLSTLVAAMSGLNIASITTSTSISLPAMLKRKYNKLMVTGVVAAGGSLGFLIPPSLIFILYGLIAGVSIGHLWLAGIVPGILLAAMFVIYIGVRCKLQPHLGPALPVEERVGWGGKFRSLGGAALLPIALIGLVLGLLFTGVTSLVEASAVGAVGSLGCAAANRRLKWETVRGVMDETLKISTMILWIFATALLFSSVFDGLGAISGIERMLYMVGGGRWGILIMMQLSFFVLGAFLDDTAMLVIVAPLFIPLVDKLGFDLVWFGVLYVLNCQMAYLTPPFGYNLFMMKALIPSVAPDSGITIRDLYRSIIPFVALQAVGLALVMAFPEIALWLPSLVFAE